MNIVIVGHVDHGKSTVIGRLLVDTGSLPEGKLQRVEESCKKNSKPFEYAFLLDALKDEQRQGITIDSSRVFFKSKLREYMIIDAPGHIDFLKSMLSGASQATAALLVVDAKEGLQENSKRHANLLSLIGVQQVAVIINKMDLVNYGEKAFNSLVTEFREFLKKIKLVPACFVPASGFCGDNISISSKQMEWYSGETVLEVLDKFKEAKSLDDMPFRMSVQDIYKFTMDGDSRRIIAGTVNSGSIKVDDEIIFFPSGKKSKVKSIEAFNEPKFTQAFSGKATGITLHEQVYISRGEVVTKSGEDSLLFSTQFKVNLLWLDRTPLSIGKPYTFKIGTMRVPMKVSSIEKVYDTSEVEEVEGCNEVGRNQIGECVLSTSKPIAFDTIGNIPEMSRFVIVDNYEVSGGGVILESLRDGQGDRREDVFLRNVKWEKSFIPRDKRIERFSQKPSLVMVTGPKSEIKKHIAKELEVKLFTEGKVVCYIGMANIIYGMDADIREHETSRHEHIRRLSEVAYILLDMGVILIVNTTNLTNKDLDIIKIGVDYEDIEMIWVGDKVDTDLKVDLIVSGEAGTINESVEQIKAKLQEKGVIFRG